jgi:hypothetical protein
VPNSEVNAGSSTKLGRLILVKRLWASDNDSIRLHSAAVQFMSALGSNGTIELVVGL